jgi:hypothetical protein
MAAKGEEASMVLVSTVEGPGMQVGRVQRILKIVAGRSSGCKAIILVRKMPIRESSRSLKERTCVDTI